MVKYLIDDIETTERVHDANVVNGLEDESESIGVALVCVAHRGNVTIQQVEELIGVGLSNVSSVNS